MLISEVKINIADADITCYYCISKRITNKRKFGNPAVDIISVCVTEFELQRPRF